MYDPAFAYETAAIIRDGIERMYGARPEDVLYYLTLYNENHVMPRAARGRRRDDGRRCAGSTASAAPEVKATERRRPLRATLLGRRLDHAAGAPGADHPGRAFGVAADVWSAPSYQLLRNDALEVERWNRLHPADEPRRAAA